MFRKSIIILVLAALAVMPGCGTNSNTSAGLQSAQNSQSQTNSSDSRGAGKFELADLMGEITSVSSNKVTVKVIKMPAFSAKGSGKNGGKNSSNSQSTVGDNEKNQKMTPPSENSGTYQNDKSNGGTRRGGELQYTGETKTVTIPSDMKITTFARGDDNKQSLKLADLKQGDILEIWYSDKDKETIEKVSVRAAQQNQDSRNSGTK